MRKPWHSLLVLLAIVLSGCQGATRTFAGFTFGGGGNTFDCEPALWTSSGQSFQLKAGTPGQATYLELKGEGPLKLGEPAALSQASVAVPDHQGIAGLASGSLVQQSVDGSLTHGSFELTVKSADGREFTVVGSYTASVESPPSSQPSPAP